MFAALARLAINFRWAILLIVGAAVVPAAVFGAGVFDALKPGGFDAPDEDSFRARALIEERLGIARADVIALYSLEDGASGDITTSAAVPNMQAALDSAASDEGVRQVVSFFNTGGAQFISANGNRTFAVFTLVGDDKERLDTFERIEPLLHVDGVTTEIGGEIAAAEAFGHTFEEDLRRAEIISFPILAILLLLIFRTVVAASLALILGALAIVFALALLRTLSLVTDVSVFAVNVVTILGLGTAVDYSLFMLSRYREELQTQTPEAALTATVTTTGKAVAFSGITLATSLIGLFVFPQLFLRSMAMGGIAVATMAILIAVTVLPALIAALGPRVEALPIPFFRTTSEADRPGDGFWHVLAMQVMRRPALIGAAVVVFLLLLGSPFLRLETSRLDVRALNDGYEVRRVNDVMNAELLPNETTPHLVALEGDGDLLEPADLAVLLDYHNAVTAIPGITRVDSVFSLVPGATPEQHLELLSAPPQEMSAELAAVLPLFVDGNVMRLSAVSAFEVDDPEAQDQVHELRNLPQPDGIEARIGGNAAEILDTRDVVISRVPLTLGIVAVATFSALFLVFGSVVLPIKAMIMNALSLTASYGAVVFIFQDGRFESLLRYESLGTIDVTTPVLMFAFLFGLSMDYEVLMLSRVREEYVRIGDNSLAVARGLEKTGRLITSAAALLIVVLVAFATSGLALMKALGIGMALAIAIDATIVRALLVPASMRLMGELNWWAPQPLVRLWERAGLADMEGHGAAAEAVPARVHPSVVIPARQASEMAPVAQVAAAATARSATIDAPPAPATVRFAPPDQSDGATVVLARGALAMAFLVEADSDQPAEHVLEFGLSEIGRQSTCTIVISDPRVSGRHATIERRPDGTVVIDDRGSTNGTFVNGERISGPTMIEDGHEVALAERRFFLRVEQPAPEPEPIPEPEPEPEPVPTRPPSMVDQTVVLRAAPQGFDYLVQVAGPGAGVSYPISGDTMTIGRDPRNDIVVTDPKVSAFHAHLQRGLDGGLVIEDRGSTNGTSINGAALEGAHRLVDDDIIDVGDSALQFKRFTAREVGS